MSKGKRIRLLIEENGVLYKVTSLYFLSDGSVKLDVPYCKSQFGSLIKYAFSYKPGEINIPFESIKSRFSVSRPPQLSLHASGFVQFSGPGIRSGIDKQTGEIKGLGLFSNPLARPVTTGPTFSSSVWGLASGFDKVENLELGDIPYYAENFVPRYFTKDDVLNTYVFEFFLLPITERLRKWIFETEYGSFALLNFRNYIHHPLFICARIEYLKQIPTVLAILPFKAESNYSKKYEFGYSLDSPSQRVSTDPDIYVTMNAVSPETLGDNAPSLEYDAELK